MFFTAQHQQTTAVSGKPGVLSRMLAARDFRRLKNRPRYVPFTIQLSGKTIRGVDGPSFFYSFREIFVERIYAFNAQTSSPRIIDGGSNGDDGIDPNEMRCVLVSDGNPANNLDITLTNLTVQNGVVKEEQGGANISNRENLTLTNCRILNGL